jgi:hypothetical protein
MPLRRQTRRFRPYSTNDGQRACFTYCKLGNKKKYYSAVHYEMESGFSRIPIPNNQSLLNQEQEARISATKALELNPNPSFRLLKKHSYTRIKPVSNLLLLLCAMQDFRSKHSPIKISYISDQNQLSQVFNFYRLLQLTIAFRSLKIIVISSF